MWCRFKIFALLNLLRIEFNLPYLAHATPERTMDNTGTCSFPPTPPSDIRVTNGDKTYENIQRQDGNIGKFETDDPSKNFLGRERSLSQV